MIVLTAVASLALLGVPATPAHAQFDTCVLEGAFVLSAFLFAESPAQVSGTLQFTPPGTCTPGAPGSVTVALSVFAAGSPAPAPIGFTWSYAVDAAGTVDLGPGVLRGAIGHSTGLAHSVVFTADPALPPPGVQLAGAAVREEFAFPSSRRFKEDVRDLGDASRGLERLRPVTFRYKRAEPDGTRPRQYGLIAEEVAAVYPELVQYGATGEPQAVRYHELPAMLLNEIQRQQRQIAAQQAELQAQAAQLAGLLARLARLERPETGSGRDF
jgi:hypothetical protein